MIVALAFVAGMLVGAVLALSALIAFLVREWWTSLPPRPGLTSGAS